VAGRIGIDIAPVDVADADAVRWMEALIWPDQVERLAHCDHHGAWMAWESPAE